MWKSVCCEVQGLGHQKSSTPCQDKTFSLTQNGIHIIALADGAGSAKLSHFGAECVVRSASALLARRFQDYLACEDGRQVKQEIVTQLRQDLQQQADLLGCELSDLASTLLLAAVWEDWFILAHIGDGVIGYLDRQQLKVASTPDNGEFSNETTFVTSRQAAASMRLFKGKLEEKSAFVLMSDGTEQSLYQKSSKTLAGIVVKLMHRTCLINGEAMKRQLEEAFQLVILPNTQDDCSIAILARPSDTLSVFEELSFPQRQQLYQLSGRAACAQKQVKRYDDLMDILQTPHSLPQIAGKICLKPKYTKKHLDQLLRLGLIQRDGIFYQRTS